MARLMPNVFDQFDGQVPAPGATGAAAAAGVPQPVKVEPGGDVPAAAEAAAPDQMADVVDPTNAFDNPALVPAEAVNQKMTDDQFSAALYERLNAGESPEAILQWSSTVGHPIRGNEAFYKNIQIRDAARRAGKPGKYGRTQDMTGMDGFDTVGEAGAFTRQAGNTVLGNFGDEALAALQAIPAALRTGTMPWNTPEYGETWNELQSVNDVDWAAHPISSAGGVATGAVLAGRVSPSFLSAPKVAAVGRVVPGAGKLARLSAAGKGLAVRSAVGSAEGAGYGAVAATGEGSMDDRFRDTGAGATLGAGVGAAVIPVVEGFGRLARPIRERLFTNSNRALAERLGLTADDYAHINAEAQRLEDLGTPYALIDVLPERARSVIGSAGRHESARDILQDVAGQRRTELPSRVKEQAASEIGGVSDHPDDLELGINTYRNKQMDEAIEPIRDRPLPLDHGTIEALATGQGRRALNAAIEAEPNLARRQQLIALRNGLNIVADIDPRLPQAVHRQIMAAAVGDAFNINASDRVARELYGMAEAGGTDRGALTSLADTIRDAAKQDDAYSTAMRDYATRSKSVEALNVGRGGQVAQRTEGAGFLGEEPQRFERQVAGTRQQPAWKYDTEAEAKIEELRRKVASRYVGDDGLGGSDFMSDFELDEAARHPEFKDAFVRELRQNGIHEDVIKQVTAGELPGSQRVVRTQQRRDIPGNLAVTDNLEPPNPGAAAREYTPPPTPPEDWRQGLDDTDLDDLSSTDSLNGANTDWEGASNEELYDAIRRGDPSSIPEFNRRDSQDPDFSRFVDEAEESDRVAAMSQFTDDPTVDVLRPESRGPSKESVIERFKQHPGVPVEHNLKYTAEDGRTVTGTVKVKPNSDVGVIYVAGISEWGRTSNTYGPAMMKNIASLIREKFPQIRYVVGSRVTGARARAGARPDDPFQAVPAKNPNIIKDAPTERELARTGARYQVDRAAGEGPGAAKRVADDLVNSPDQRQRTEALIGPEKADRLSAKMKAELDRVYRVERQATREGPAREGGLAAVESGVNTLYNPGPISVFRETARFLHRIGMSEKDARWIVTAATDPTQTEAIVARLQKLGMDKVKAQAYTSQLRDAAVRYSTSNEDF